MRVRVVAPAARVGDGGPRRGRVAGRVEQPVVPRPYAIQRTAGGGRHDRQAGGKTLLYGLAVGLVYGLAVGLVRAGVD
jgi:hypothetical protein